MSSGDTRSGPATQLFAAWWQRETEGRAEPFEALVVANPHLAEALLRMRAEQEHLLRARRQEPGAQGEPRRPSGGSPGALVGRVLGDFRVLREIGRGGMGIVYEAEQISLRRSVALKILPAQLSLNERALERFQREAEITGRMHHRGIVEVYQVGEHDGVHFIAMELIEGTSLDKLVERMRGESFQDVRKRKIGDLVSVHGLEDEPPPAPASDAGSPGRRRSATKKPSSSVSNKNYVESSIKLICQVADALQHAHSAGVIHRDVKPSNVLVRRDGVAVLTDFGLAREQGLPSVSVTGDFAGTPNYVSPEQAMAGRVPVDHRSDIFSLGATLYELLTLELAFPGNNTHEVFGRILQKPPVHPQKHNPILAPDLVTIVLKALDKDPDHRYSTAAEMAEDLRAFIEYRPIRAKRLPTVMRAWRWARRQPLQAALGAVLAIGIPLLVWLVRANLSSQELLAQTQERERATSQELAPYRLTEKLDQGFLSLGIGNATEAERLFAEVLAQEAGSREALTGQVLALLGLGRVAEASALADAGQGADTVPDRLRVDVLRAAGREREAAALEAGLPEVPVQAFDKYMEALRLLRPVPFALREMELAPLLWTGPQQTASVAERADPRLVYRSAAAKAIRLLEDALVVEPSPPLYFALSWAAWVAKDASTARRYAAAIEKNWGGQAVAWYYVGLAREVFDEDAALAALARAVELEPEFVLASDRRAVLLMRHGDAPRAVAELTEALVRVPSSSRTRVRLASALLRVGRADESVTMIHAVLALEPELVEGREILFRGLLELDRPEEAREEIRRVLEIEPSSIRWNDLGLLELRLAHEAAARRGAGLEDVDVEEAERALVHAMDLDPDNPYPCFNLGVVFRDTARFEQAIEMHEAALERLSPAHYPEFSEGLVWASLGTCHESLGRLDDAIPAYERAVELDPDEPRLYVALAMAHRKAGRYAEMDAWLLRGIRSALDPESFVSFSREQHASTELIAAYVLALDEAGHADQAMDVVRRCGLDGNLLLGLSATYGASPTADFAREIQARRESESEGETKAVR